MRICGHRPLEWHTSACHSEPQQDSIQLGKHTIEWCPFCPLAITILTPQYHLLPVDTARIAGVYGNLLWRLRATKKRMISKKDLQRRLRVEPNNKTQC